MYNDVQLGFSKDGNGGHLTGLFTKAGVLEMLRAKDYKK